MNAANMGIVLDLAVLAVIIICVILSAKKGFVKTIVEVVGYIAALVLAFTLSTPIANGVYDAFVAPAVEKGLTKSAEGITEVSANGLLESLPGIITENAERFGVDTGKILSDFSEMTSEDLPYAIGKISNDIVRPIAVSLIGMAATILIFLILLFVVKLLASLLNKIFSFSIIGKVNTFLGGVVGLFKGVVVATVLCVAITLLINLLGDGFFIFTPQNIQSTYLFKFFASFSQHIQF